MGGGIVYGSVCAGIEAASVAWRPLGWRAAWLSEIDHQCRAVLAARWPDAPLRGDFREIDDAPGAIDLLVGGTPCQDFSVAGLRAGLAGERGNLTLQFVELLGRLRPRWFVLENVPGLLSLDDGRAFGAILGRMAELGYGFAFRVLDAQHFGVPQRRRRVFVVGYLGDWRPPAAVLFERESLCWDSPPSRKTRERIARPIASGPAGGTGYRNDADTADNLIAFGGNDTRGPIDVATARNAHGGPHGRLDFESETFVVGTLAASGAGSARPAGQRNELDMLIAHSLRADGFDASEDGTGRGTPLVAFSSKDYGGDAGPLAPTLRAAPHHRSHANAGAPPAIAVSLRGRDGGATAELSDVPSALRASKGGGDKAHVLASTIVRRLTPRECERLQGFPDDYTLVDYRGKPMADGPRYRMLGNSMAVPVISWLGKRIALVDALSHAVAQRA